MTRAEYALSNGLHRVGARPKLFDYLKRTWSRRDFIYMFGYYKLRSSLENNKLGMLWLVLRPIMDAFIYAAIFGVLMGRDRIGEHYVSYVIIGIFMWQLFSKSLTDGAKSITGNRALVQSLAFPRMTLPLATVIRHFLETLPSLVLMIVCMPLLGMIGEHKQLFLPRWEWLLMIPLLFIYMLFNTGIALIAARLTVHLRDLTQLLPYITRLLMYASGVIFQVDTIFRASTKYSWVASVFDYYPLYQFLSLTRSFLRGYPMNPEYWVSISIWAVAVFVVGLLFFWVAEERYGRD
ncbi:MAG: ABC transporter permease [Propionibacteriaceae bacterium]|jgi:teichoic acid transport system permease protein|nr:ABC transporter permease [Propionibacteriaceae bacterium]